MATIRKHSENVMQRYQRSLGAFIHDFTILEAFLVGLLCSIAGITEEMGRALFSGTRADTLVSFIKRCHAVGGHEIAPGLERALQQVAVLNAARNEVVHLATFAIEDENEAVLLTSGLRYTAAQAKSLMRTPEALDHMAHDARMIVAIVSVAEGKLASREAVARRGIV